MKKTTKRDHGGGLDAAIARFGGTRESWLDLSTGINPIPYALPDFPPDAWTALPDQVAEHALIAAARRFWHIPAEAMILAAPGASALIARLPALLPSGTVDIPAPTYNEHAAAFRAAGWHMGAENPTARVIVHPNNPDGRLYGALPTGQSLLIIDESFCDVTPGASHIAQTTRPGVIILKSFGKFWGLAGLRLGFAIGTPATIAPLKEMLGPWSISGPALAIATKALEDEAWATATRARLKSAAKRLDNLLAAPQITALGGTDLFRLYQLKDAKTLQKHLATRHILTRIFPYSNSWIRFGLPGSEAEWQRLQTALSEAP